MESSDDEGSRNTNPAAKLPTSPVKKRKSRKNTGEGSSSRKKAKTVAKPSRDENTPAEEQAAKPSEEDASAETQTQVPIILPDTPSAGPSPSQENEEMSEEKSEPSRGMVSLAEALDDLRVQFLDDPTYTGQHSRCFGQQFLEKCLADCRNFEIADLEERMLASTFKSLVYTNAQSQKMANIRAQATALETAQSELQKEKEAWAAEKEKLLAEKVAVDQMYKETKEAVDNQARQLAELQASTKGPLVEIERLTAESKRQAQELALERKDKAQLQDQVAVLKKDSAALEAKNSQLKKVVKNAFTEIVTWCKEVAESKGKKALMAEAVKKHGVVKAKAEEVAKGGAAQEEAASKNEANEAAKRIVVKGKAKIREGSTEPAAEKTTTPQPEKALTIAAVPIPLSADTPQSAGPASNVMN